MITPDPFQYLDLFVTQTNDGDNPLIFVGVAKAEKAIEWDRNSAIAHKW